VPTTPPDLSLGDDLRAFVDAAPSPFHAVAELARRLSAAGFTELAEADRWGSRRVPSTS
jgi:aspartyl aminopeptidase